MQTRGQPFLNARQIRCAQMREASYRRSLVSLIANCVSAERPQLAPPRDSSRVTGVQVPRVARVGARRSLAVRGVGVAGPASVILQLDVRVSYLLAPDRARGTPCRLGESIAGAALSSAADAAPVAMVPGAGVGVCCHGRPVENWRDR
jgi:hypothetical protein